MVVVLVSLLLGAVITTGVITALDGEDGGRAPVGRLTQMEQSGDMQDTMERHRQMLQQMQDNATPAMLQLMNNDPMWEMMRSADWTQMQEQHQADVDRMLGKGQP
ncbi:MAG: hypothetical protein ACLGI2_07840 [Acidimicrobiia bacterium]